MDQDLGHLTLIRPQLPSTVQYLAYRGAEAAGHPRQYDSKVDLQDLTRFTFVETVQPQFDLYTQRVWHVSLKRAIRVTYLVDHRLHRVRTCLLFSTDVGCRTRPDSDYAVLQTALSNRISLPRRETIHRTVCLPSAVGQKAGFPFQCQFHRSQSCQAGSSFVFSMASVKRRALNDHLLDTLISTLDLSPPEIKSHPNYQTLGSYGVIAA
ncbi:hypothetical protein C7B65_14115 [Phormidesmis priestleyi ULC007]|uniref:Uncharacterized protein n=1 Tax=Phormidesmis priestleyi ULC007 TaxID=1920490 RepID=A0A2T1DDV0_9CYAN|nr:hypothetical protein C7B65_14115 [Phormidesmis priestleyi ULC007]